MGMVAILVMWPGPFKQTFVPPSQGGSIWNLASTWMTEAYLYYQLTNEPKGSGELKSGD